MKSIAPFTEYHPDSLALLPALSLMRAECECCAEPAGWALALSFACFTVIFTIGPKHADS